MNNDLISRSALLAELDLIEPIEYLYESEHEGWLDARLQVEKAPSVDAEVVRCKDCMHYNHAVIDDDPAETFEVDVCLHKDLFPTRVTPDFYCAHGERKMDVEVEGC